MGINLQYATDIEAAKKLKIGRVLLWGLFPFILIGEFIGWQFFCTFVPVVGLLFWGGWPFIVVITVCVVIGIKVDEHHQIKDIKKATSNSALATRTSPAPQAPATTYPENVVDHVGTDIQPSSGTTAPGTMNPAMAELEKKATAYLKSNNAVEYLRAMTKLHAMAIESYEMDLAREIQARIDEFRQGSHEK